MNNVHTNNENSGQNSSPTHPHNEKVLERECTPWVEESLANLFEIDTDESPLYSNTIYDPYDDRYRFKEHRKEDTTEGVYFLYSRYSDPDNYSYQYHLIPRGDWHILGFYGFYYPLEVYKSKNADELYSLAKRELESTYRLEAKLDGKPIEFCRVSIDKPVEIKNIPVKNIFGLRNKELDDAGRKLHTVGDFYVVFLKPLEIGTHFVDIAGYSPSYTMNAGFQLDVIGP